ncbi:cobyrinate a,c-diamide synthase [Tannerella forsythia]|uniref:cobyrinate a,c-diamide synthase n=1 Tax=Tannerella forsythia TaxID=28112 RepID=UPI000BE6F924|nr:cobyrinate a,c-diamide synthase [Tannerella forsythia]PDP70637.1 cobyrinic acid a,c-diamide synthase [Tannerella forsythia]
MKSQLLIGATGSGCGKTTFTAGLLRLIKRRGMNVQPFKCGPDYIDPHYHKLSAGCESVNLDSWLASPAHVQYLYNRYAAPAEVCVVEGVMGLFDGYVKMHGSSAETARLLNIPVVLIVNARSVAYSVAPVIYGFKHFNPEVHIVGVVFNRTASATHASYLKEACADVGVECFGCLPRINDLEIPSRHLGLTTDASFQFEQLIEKTADAIAANVDIDRLLEVCRQAVLPEVTVIPPARLPDRGLSIAVARDEAFTFTYKENIARLEQMGTVTYFSPIKDQTLPPADLVYLPGGYPEFYLNELSANRPMLEAIRSYVENGGKLLAECGGMMYLGRSITGMDGVNYPLVGVLVQEATMSGMRLHLGYRRFALNGTEWKGHEFHYSSIVGGDAIPFSIAQQYNVRDEKVDTPVYRYRNVIASYTHLYWGENDVMDLWKAEPAGP